MTDPMDRRCTAASKRTGERCKRHAIRGGTVCSMHGGKAPAVRAKANQRLAAQLLEADARAALAFEALVPIEDPVLELAGLAAEVKATMRAIGARVNALREVSYQSLTGTEQLKSELMLLGDYQDRLARMLTGLGRFDLDERRQKLDEAQAAVIIHILDRLLAHLALPADQDAAARAHLAVVLRELDQTQEARP